MTYPPAAATRSGGPTEVIALSVVPERAGYAR
jgi:hypothetical protein